MGFVGQFAWCEGRGRFLIDLLDFVYVGFVEVYLGRVVVGPLEVFLLVLGEGRGVIGLLVGLSRSGPEGPERWGR